MEKDSGSWFHHQHQNQQSSTRNFWGSPINMGSLNPKPAYMNPYCIEDSTTGTFPLFPLQQLKPSELNDYPNWFYCTSHFRQAYAPVLNSLSREELPAGSLENLGQKGRPDMCAACNQKKFLVFDQSGDKTTLLYSSGAKTLVQCATSWRPKPAATPNLVEEEPRDITSPLGPIFKDECIEYKFGNDLESEMHEDTEELNALLGSDSDSECSEDDEETSTGHSPSTMTDNNIQEMVQEKSDRGSNSVVPPKRQKLLDLGYVVPSLVHSSRSLKTHTCSELENDAEESSCGSGNNQELKKLCSLSGRKRSRIEIIHETVNILQSIIPSGKGKNAIGVIDEAIDYLRSLKVEARDLGLDTL
ncbi:transcription factor bHLH145-like [Olea europaea var. sylvestris]|uniref:transcription factor bHLH145-like n=1 Tax=Olea europaea var. sylvestris TaxID=158386 RepID=UPI000C1D81C3|nr:transcription factor bHLH145-like [Olea europaea var. sylvestris]XP_022869773.1 transcription factor bHLH145-like [Olea europaea var. sylvestris]